MGLLFESLDEVLGTRSKVRLLRALLPLVRPVSGREAARLAGIAQTPAVRALNELVAMGVLKRERRRGVHLYTANREEQLVRHVLPPLFKGERDRADEVLELLREGAASLNRDQSGRPVQSLILIGAGKNGRSFRGKLELLAVVSTRRVADGAQAAFREMTARIQRQYGVRIGLTVLTLAELRDRNARGDAWADRLTADSLTILGRSATELVGGTRAGR